MNQFKNLLPIESHFDLIGQNTTDTQIHFHLHSRSQSARCPKCQKRSTRRHSCTKRKIRDLPIAGKEVIMHLKLQKWFCLHPKCSEIIFTESLDAAPAYQRNTVRVTDCLREMAFRTNFIQAAKLSKKLNLSVSHDTLLRLIYKTPMPLQTSPFLAIDDFAFRKGDVYGTIVCDLRTNRPIALLNGRDLSTVTDWLKTQSNLYIIAHDGSNTYKTAITETSPNIVHVSDRFHLVQNLSKTMKDALIRLLPNYIELHKGQVKMKESTVSSPLTSKEEEKWALVQKIKQTHQAGISQREIARNFKMSRNTVKKYVEMEQPILYYREASVSKLIQPFYELVKERTALDIPITTILKEIKDLGFKGSYSTVRKTVERLKSKKDIPGFTTRKVAHKKIMLCFWRFYEQLTIKQKEVLNTTLSSYPETQPIYAFVQLFREAFSTIDLQRFLQLIQYFEKRKSKRNPSLLICAKK